MTGRDMEDLAAAAASALSAPEHLVVRSARARASVDGLDVETVLAAWAGGETVASGPVPTEQAESVPEGEAPPAAPAAASGEEESPLPEAAEGPEPEPVADSVPRPRRTSRFEPEEKAAAAGAIPRWLAATFVVVPVIALLYVLFLPNGPNCGDAGRLAVDPVTGEAVNCDLSPYGAVVVDFFSIGREQYAACSACHGENGAGAGNFPAFAGGALLTTFPEGQCEDQVAWVEVGTAGWPEPTYGATGKPVGGSGAVMPAFGGVLTDTELRSVIVYERVQFGGQDLEAAVADCGLQSDEGETSAAE